MRPFTSFLAILALLLSCAQPLRAQDSTTALITAPRIDNLLTVRRAADDTRAKTNADFQYAVVLPKWTSLQPDMTFTSSSDVRIAYPGFNPMRLALSASETQADDPNFKQLSEFVEALLKVPGIVTGQSSALGDCPAVQSLKSNLNGLTDRINTAKTLGQALVEWTKELDTPGPVSIKSVVDKMRQRANNIKTHADEGDALFKSIETRAGAPLPSGPSAVPPPAAAPAGGGMVAPPIAPAGGGTSGGQQPGAKPAAAAPAPAAPDCADAEVVANLVAGSVSTNPSISERLENLRKLAASLHALANALEKFANGEWEGTSYIFHTSRPTFEKVNTITIKATPLGYRMEGLVIVREEQEAKAASAKFLLRRHQSVIPELGAGFVITTMKAPKYGTGTSNGQTVVVRQKDRDVSYAGALLLNWVFTRPANSALQPVLQTGASISPDGPGIMLGAGFRIGRPKRVAVGFGGILGWVKDLTDLQAGGPVSGTAQLNEDLEYTPKGGAYFTIQYTFK